jgi:hypothetical protein
MKLYDRAETIGVKITEKGIFLHMFFLVGKCWIHLPYLLVQYCVDMYYFLEVRSLSFDKN